MSIKIRLLTKADLPTRVTWMNDIRVYPTMNYIPPISLENTNEWYKKISSDDSRKDMVFVDDEDQLLAMGGLTHIDYSSRKAEFYVFVNPELQRKGIGTTATYLLCKYGFEVLQLNKIYLYTNASNVGGIRTYNKIGFVLEGSHREEKCVNGIYENRLYYGLLARDFNHALVPLILTQ